MTKQDVLTLLGDILLMAFIVGAFILVWSFASVA